MKASVICGEPTCWMSWCQKCGCPALRCGARPTPKLALLVEASAGDVVANACVERSYGFSHYPLDVTEATVSPSVTITCSVACLYHHRTCAAKPQATASIIFVCHDAVLRPTFQLSGHNTCPKQPATDSLSMPSHGRVPAEGGHLHQVPSMVECSSLKNGFVPRT